MTENLGDTTLPTEDRAEGKRSEVRVGPPPDRWQRSTLDDEDGPYYFKTFPGSDGPVVLAHVKVSELAAFEKGENTKLLRGVKLERRLDVLWYLKKNPTLKLTGFDGFGVPLYTADVQSENAVAQADGAAQ